MSPLSCSNWPLMTRRAVLTVIPIAFLVWILHHLGWLTPRRPWQESTGWNNIPEALRPTAKLNEEFTLDWLGHSGFVIRWAGQTLLLDPNTSARCTVSRRVMELPTDIKTVGRVDAVLISHAHYDHLNLDTLLRLQEIGFTAVPDGAEVYFERAAAHAKPRPVRVGEQLRVGKLEIFPVPAAHNGSRFHPWRSPKPAVGYIIRSPTRTLYYAGDTAFHNDFAAIRDRFHPDIAILPIGAYEPRHALKIHHMNPEEAVEAALLLGVQIVVPCHFGTFTLSRDRPADALPRFAKAAFNHNLRWAMPALLTP